MNEGLADIESRRWIAKAESDLKHAKNSFEVGDYDWVLLASQQAGEKALKAVCIKKGIGLTKTHDLSSLARKLKAPKEIIIEAGLLNPFYTISRYPDLEFFSEEEIKNAAIDALNAAGKVVEWCKKQ
jgi:HEPN domain-containing protein